MTRYILKGRSVCIFVALLMIISIYACKKENKEVPATRYYYQYYPLKVGDYRIYSVDSIPFKEGPTAADTVHFQLKELVQSTYKDASGEQMYRVEVYRRPDEIATWQMVHVYATGLPQYYADVIDNNIRIVKLEFPVTEGHSWNANRFNTTDSARFLASKYVQAHKPYTAGGKTYDSVAVVEIKNENDFVTKSYQAECYATNYGLVYSVTDELDIQHPNPADSSTLDIKGYIYRKTLLQYSH